MSETELLEELLDPLSKCLNSESARRLVEFRISPAVQAKAEEFAEQANEGALTEEERVLYESLINATDVISILKSKARSFLESNPAS